MTHEPASTADAGPQIRCAHHLHMPDLPTSVYHLNLLDPEREPLISCTLTNRDDRAHRLRVIVALRAMGVRA